MDVAKLGGPRDKANFKSYFSNYGLCQDHTHSCGLGTRLKITKGQRYTRYRTTVQTKGKLEATGTDISSMLYMQQTS